MLHIWSSSLPRTRGNLHLLQPHIILGSLSTHSHPPLMMTLLLHNSVALKHTRASLAVLDGLPLPCVLTWPQSILSSLPTGVNHLWGTCVRHYMPSTTSIPLTITGSPSCLQPPLLFILISTSLTPLTSKPIRTLNHLLPPTAHHLGREIRSEFRGFLQLIQFRTF
jgi:hypothetical protein